ncbi:MAG TPA: ABC transporter ATP-binding protein [Streptosporangiaceae bacterium]|jgi:ABC-2 type transport system ATP-binding protein
MTEPILTTSALTRDYGGTGLLGVDLVVPTGAIYGLVGLNGAGKTTLLALLTGLRRPDSGTISLRISRRRLAYCPDVSEFDPWLTAREVVDLALSLTDSRQPEERADHIDAALADAGLTGSVSRRVGGFSRGMTARLGLACALASDPDLLILDEPAAALDPVGRAELLTQVAAMRGHRTVLFSSHILGDVQRIADQVGILRAGRLLYQGSTQELIDTYLTPAWLVRIAGDASGFLAAATGADWVTAVRSAPGDGAVRIEATSMAAGERGIPALVAACGLRLAAMEPAGADLESAFLALTTGVAGAAA